MQFQINRIARNGVKNSLLVGIFPPFDDFSPKWRVIVKES
jgi:hypothetical protein